MAINQDARPDPIPPKHVLYVVLHGLICLVDDGDKFLAYALEQQDQHKYLYGDWLNEYPIPQRAQGADPFRARLCGVNPGGSAILDPNQNAIVPLETLPSDTHPNVRAVFTLPRPECIDHFLCGQVPGGMFSDASQLVKGVAPLSVCAIRVFTYTFQFEMDEIGDEIYPVQLTAPDGTALWECPPAVEPAGRCDLRVAALHIFDEPGPDVQVDPIKHNIDEFNQGTAFLNVSLTISKAAIVGISNSDPLPGLLGGELDQLSVRATSVLTLLAAARSDTDAFDSGGSSSSVCNGPNGVFQKEDQKQLKKQESDQCHGQSTTS